MERRIIMKITLNTEELKEKLTLAKGVSSGKNMVMPTQAHCLIEVKEKAGSIFATDTDIAVNLPLSVEETEGEITLCLHTGMLYDIVKTIESETVTIETVNSDQVLLRAGKSKFKLNCSDPEMYPHWEDPVYSGDVHTVVLPAKRLLEMIDKTIFAAGDNDVRYTLNSLLFHIEPDWFRLVGTDGNRLALITDFSAETPTLKDPIKAIVPKRACQELKKLLKEDGNVQITVTEKIAWFLLENGISFMTRTIEGTYPSYENVIPNYENMATISRDSLLKALKLSSIVASEDSGRVTIKGETGAIEVKAEAPVGNYSDTIEDIYGEIPKEVSFNFKYLLDAISRMEGDNIYYRFNPEEELTPIVITGDDTDFLYVFMPLRQ
ncbi:MAG: DNA polymerase III subunit beta [Nitrospirae bacterium]|nr:MAG: DNA polymerase III subunit beta [Nitrospirota bacterium]